MHAHTRSLLLFLLAAAGCASDPTRPPATGSLSLTLTGLPSVAASVMVNGPGGFSRLITQSQTLMHLAPGAYRISAPNLAVNDDIYAANFSDSVVQLLPAASRVAVTVHYAIASASIEVLVSGLLAGTPAGVMITGPAAFSKAISATTTLSGLAPGVYVITATVVTASGSTFAPVVSSQTQSLVASTTPSTVTVTYALALPVAKIAITPPYGIVYAGFSKQYAATTSDVAGGFLSGRAISWTSDNLATATVTATGLVTGVGLGTANITATSEGVRAVQPITVIAGTPCTGVCLSVYNRLDVAAIVEVAWVYYAGPLRYTRLVVGAGRMGAMTVPTQRRSLAYAKYSIVQPLSPLGTPMGDSAAGQWQAYRLFQNGERHDLFITNVISGNTYFAPLITNDGAAPILMAANWGLPFENRCGCTVPSGGVDQFIGYYRLDSATVVRAFGVTGGYDATEFTSWGFAEIVAGMVPQSGTVRLVNHATLAALLSPDPFRAVLGATDVPRATSTRRRDTRSQ